MIQRVRKALGIYVESTVLDVPYIHSTYVRTAVNRSKNYKQDSHNDIVDSRRPAFGLLQYPSNEIVLHINFSRECSRGQKRASLVVRHFLYSPAVPQS